MASSTSSRIFIKNLPSTLSNEDFRKHFAHHAPPTDAKFLPHRRIGYVGYKTAEDASRAVKYFHKSFIGMARLSVELAMSVDESNEKSSKRRKIEGGPEETASKQHENYTNEEKGTAVPIRGTKSDTGKAGQDAKLREYLQVMQPPSKTKVWENQDRAGPKPETMADAITETPKALNADSDSDYEEVPRKADLEKPRLESKLPSPPNTPAADVEMEDQPVVIEENTAGDTAEGRPSASDADWLRSRTSRLLGLVDDDETLEELTPGNHEMATHPNSIEQLRSQRTNGETNYVHDAAPKLEDQHADQAQSTSEKGDSDGNGRLFIRNLTYTATKEDLRVHFESHGFQEMEEVHLPIDSRSGVNKGFAHIQFTDPRVATAALAELDQRPFQGRLLHILPSNAKKQNSLDEFAISKLPLKKQQQIKRKAEAASSNFNWNSMYMSSDAVISSVADRLRISKSELLDPTSSDAAIKQAHAETHVIQETKSYFVSNGVDIEAFKKKERGDTTILVKNFTYGTRADELKQHFEAYGTLSRMLMPPSGTIAIVQFERPEQANSAFVSLAYSKFKDSLLFLEKAPKDLFKSDTIIVEEDKAKAAKLSATDLLTPDAQQESVDTSTLFVRNLNFSTTNDRLREVFKPISGFLSARVKTKTDAKKPGQILSMGFGFLEFQTKQHAEAAIASMDGYKLDGHELLIRASHKTTDAAEERRKGDRAKKMEGRRTKIIIKNLPFEATKKDVRALFGTYGHLRSVRVPKKFDSSTRGFAFADFITAREAENAMEALRDTHLLGRRLVLEFAAEDTIDPETEIERMQQKVSKQSDKVALQRLVAGSARTKFNVEGAEELDQGL